MRKTKVARFLNNTGEERQVCVILCMLDDRDFPTHWLQHLCLLSSCHQIRKPSLERTSAGSEFLLLLCLHGWLLLYLLNCLYLYPCCLNLNLLILSPMSLGESGQAVVWCLVVRWGETSADMFTPAESCTRKARQPQTNTALSIDKVWFSHHSCTLMCRSYLKRSVCKEKGLHLPGYFCQGLVQKKVFFTASLGRQKLNLLWK